MMGYAMTRALSDAALRIGCVVNDAIDSSFQDPDLLVIDMRDELIVAYHALCDVLSGILGVDAHKMIQRISEAEIETARAMLRAQGAPI